MEIWTYMIYINDGQLFVTFQRKSTKTQFWSDVTKISWTQKPCSYIAVENIERKGEIACDNQFLLFSQCFLPYNMTLIFHFKCTLKCRLQFVSISTSLKFCRLVMG